MPISAYYPGGRRIEVPPDAVKEWQSQVRCGLTTLGLASWYAPLEENPPPAFRTTVPDTVDIEAAGDPRHLIPA